jgi:hypothetical protein
MRRNSRNDRSNMGIGQNATEMENCNYMPHIFLKRMCGLVVEEGMWRRKTNQELKELYKDLDIADIKGKRLELVEHVARIDQGRTVEKIFLRVNRRVVKEGEDVD